MAASCYGTLTQPLPETHAVARVLRLVSVSQIEPTNTTTTERDMRQQGRDIWQFLEQAWIAHHRGGLMPSLLPDP